MLDYATQIPISGKNSLFFMLISVLESGFLGTQPVATYICPALEDVCVKYRTYCTAMVTRKSQNDSCGASMPQLETTSCNKKPVNHNEIFCMP